MVCAGPARSSVSTSRWILMVASAASASSRWPARRRRRPPRSSSRQPTCAAVVSSSTSRTRRVSVPRAAVMPAPAAVDMAAAAVADTPVVVVADSAAVAVVEAFLLLPASVRTRSPHHERRSTAIAVARAEALAKVARADLRRRRQAAASASEPAATTSIGARPRFPTRTTTRALLTSWRARLDSAVPSPLPARREQNHA